MQTLKKWTKTGNTCFTLWDNGQQIGTMETNVASLKSAATFKLEGRIINVKKTGFWKNKLELTDQKGQIICTVSPEKWYSNTSVVEYGKKTYTLLVRNNPLAEWALQDNKKDLLAYGLDTNNGKAVVRITGSPTTADYLPDFILWYLFAPIATEQMSDDFSNLLLFSA